MIEVMLFIIGEYGDIKQGIKVLSSIISEYIDIIKEDYCDLIDNHKNYTDIAGVRVFGMVHCGASGVNVNRKKGTRTDKNKKGIELMIQDWEEIKKYLEDKDIFLNLKPVN